MSARISRPVTGFLALALITAILALDLGQSGAPDLFTAPPAFAFGSGAAPEGAHCTGG
ncbi:hypothetical protein [Roseinatronobacter bogoriensis]|uniref:Uncharacterized protein n=1 Tax=Roseinatronobacter bogoriensis subsp. barguzinensis TaxID=441209 RepID=A0A2K8KJM7_9RHOB|nr:MULTISPECIES: hypothetical protein [Rhodobaca]ATX66490.1 hypothetical protein BG454_12270 [Rhodobaca barguzinensis]MBB4207649.1 hypothetical protein [Rhodobaca bogoriensis DSM 18756]TDW40044.1 hypothetical protein LY39_01077 [Rhodobaca barguzinensis]TDY70803.1 hypothetical protein EV660_102479 [Rhodobaca bogoriensis DSM 18756]